MIWFYYAFYSIIVATLAGLGLVGFSVWGVICTLTHPCSKRTDVQYLSLIGCGIGFVVGMVLVMLGLVQVGELL